MQVKSREAVEWSFSWPQGRCSNAGQQEWSAKGENGDATGEWSQGAISTVCAQSVFNGLRADAWVRIRLDGYSKRGKERALIADRRFTHSSACRTHAAPGPLCKIHIQER